MTRIEEIRKRVDQATDGPWYVEDRRPGHDDEARVYDGRSMGVCKPTTNAPAYRRPVAEFIAHAREDVPYLLAEIERRDAALRALVEQLGTIWNDERNCNAARADMALWCRNELSRLLEQEP